MKFNWGTGITIFITLFIGHILYLVFRTTQVSADLQAEDYYEQEINYQERIEAKHNTEALSSAFQFEQNENSIDLSYPKEFDLAPLMGKVSLFRPDNANLDREFPIKTGQLDQQIMKTELVKGWYVMKVNGVSNGDQYYFEEAIYIK